MKRWMKIFLITAVLLVLAAEFLLPRAVEVLVAHSLSRMTGDSQVKVTAAGKPAFPMVLGRFDLLAVDAAEVKIDKLTFSQVAVRLEQVELDTVALYSQRLLVLKSAVDIELVAVISQEELARYLNRDVKGVKNATVTVSPEKTTLKGDVSLAGLLKTTMDLEGRIIADGQQIKFVTQRFGVNHSTLGKFSGSATTEIPLVDLNKAPFPVNLRQLVMEAGQVTIRADNHPR